MTIAVCAFFVAAAVRAHNKQKIGVILLLFHHIANLYKAIACMFVKMQGGEEGNKANLIDKAGGGRETRQLNNNNQLMIVKVSGASGRGGQWRGGKRW